MPFRDYTPTLRPTPALADRGACTLTFAKKMMTRLAASFLAASVLSSCAILTKQQRHVVAQAELIRSAPIKRDKIINVFGLKDIKSQRLDGSVRGGRMYFTETWEHRSGLSIKAFDSEYVGAMRY
jgi:hypothetical protein